MSDDAAPKMGRPTDYDPAHCEAAIAFLSEGYSTTALAGELGVSRSTLYRWADAHEDFRDALKGGQAGSALWWEGKLREIAQKGGAPGQATAVIFALKNRAPEDWRERSEVDHSSKDGSMSPHGASADAALHAMRRKHGATEGDA